MASKFISGYVWCLQKARYPLLLAWLVVFIICCIFAFKFPSEVTQDIQPPKDSDATKARDFFRTNFYNASHATGIVIFTESIVGGSLAADEDYLQFDRALEYYCKHETLDFPKTGFNITANDTHLVTYSSFRAVEAANMPPLVARQYLSDSNSSAFITVAYSMPQESSEAVDFAKNLADAVDMLLMRYGLTNTVEGSVFSLPNFLEEIGAATNKDIIRMFGIVLPIALLIFCISLSSIRLVILPVVTLFVSLLMTYAFMYAVAKSIAVNSLAPGVSSAICLAFVIDYSYFIATKYRKAVLHADEEALSDQEIVEHMLSTGGRAVIVSGSVMVFCSLGVVFFPIEMLRTIGLSSMIAAATATIACVNLLPVILLSFPRFFSQAAYPWCTTKVIAETFPSLLGNNPDGNTPKNRKSYRQSIRTSTRATGYNAVPPDAKPVDPSDPHIKYHNRIFEVVTIWPVNIIVAIFAIAVAVVFVCFAFGGTYSNDIEQFVPRKSSLLGPWHRMQQVFGAGEVFSYNIVIDFHESAFNQEKFTVAQDIIWTMGARLPHTEMKDFDGIPYDGVQSSRPQGGNVTFAEVFTCFIGALQGQPMTPECFYRIATTSIFVGQKERYSTDPNYNLMYFMFRPRWSPTSPTGVEWYDAARDLVPELERNYNVSMYLYGYGADTIDTVEYAKKVMPVIAGVLAPIIFFIVGISFGSLVIPLKCLLSVFLTLGTCFGMANIVYVKKDFNFLQFGGLEGEGAIAWMVPLSVFLIVSGIALNYDLITIVTILEFRWRGLDTHSAIVKGAVANGREISVSAFMMIIVFTGLLFSEVAAMNQLGMFFVSCAAVQGLFFRLFLTPTVMSLLGPYNWWPADQCRDCGISFKPLVLPPVESEQIPEEGAATASEDYSPVVDHENGPVPAPGQETSMGNFTKYGSDQS